MNLEIPQPEDGSEGVIIGEDSNVEKDTMPDNIQEKKKIFKQMQVDLGNSDIKIFPGGNENEEEK